MKTKLTIIALLLVTGIILAAVVSNGFKKWPAYLTLNPPQHETAIKPASPTPQASLKQEVAQVATMPVSVRTSRPTIQPGVTLYVTKRFMVGRSDGLHDFSIGKKVTLVRQDIGDYIVTDGKVEGRSPKESFTVDPPSVNQVAVPPKPSAPVTSAKSESERTAPTLPLSPTLPKNEVLPQKSAWNEYNRAFLEDFKRMDLLIAKTKLIEVDLKPGSSNVRVFLSINEVRNQFKQWDINGQVGYLIKKQVAMLTKLIVMKQLEFNKKHNIPNNGEIVGSLGVVGVVF